MRSPEAMKEAYNNQPVVHCLCIRDLQATDGWKIPNCSTLRNVAVCSSVVVSQIPDREDSPGIAFL